MKRIILFALAAAFLLIGCERLDPLPEVPEIGEPYETHPGISWEPITASRTLIIGEEVISTAEFDYYLNSISRIYFGSLMTDKEFEEMAADDIQEVLILLAYAEEHGIELEEGAMERERQSAADYAERQEISLEDLIAEEWGSNVTVDEFWKIFERRMLSTLAGEKMAEAFSWTEEELRDYFDSNRDSFSSSENGVSVRHILVGVYGTESAEADGREARTREEARVRADGILAKWKDGAADESYFAELAEEYTDDAKGIGGLYTNITPESEYMEEFRDWAVSEDRKPGDTGIVEIDGWYHGFHIMYYVGYSWVELAKMYMSTIERDDYVNTRRAEFPIVLE
jgi:hypothetical protein